MAAADPFTAIEDGAVAAIKAATVGKVQLVDNAPPNWTKDMLKRAALKTPAVFVAVTGGTNASPGADLAMLAPSASVIVITSNVKEQAMRRGDATSAGAYQIAFTIIPALHGFKIDQVGEMQFVDIEPVDPGQWDLEGLCLYEIGFNVTEMQLPPAPDPALMHPFQTFHADWRNPGDTGAGGESLATDTVMLPQT